MTATECSSCGTTDLSNHGKFCAGAWSVPSNPTGVTVSYVQYDGDGEWLDVTLSTGTTYRLDTGWLVRRIVDAVQHREERVGLVTAAGVLRWGKELPEHVEKV